MAVKKILSVKVSDLTLDPNNARKHGESDVAAIAASLSQFGQQTPLVITSDNVVIKGNGTLMAAMKLDWTHIDAIRTNLTGQQVTAYAIADNQTGLLSTWDNEKLLELLQGIDEQSLIDACGFDEMAMAELLKEVHPEIPVDIVEDEVPEPPDEPITKRGDLWLLGDHRVLCGDSTKAEEVDRLLGGRVPFLMVTDPPYGVEYDADWRNDALRSDGTPIAGRAIGKVMNDDRVDWTQAYSLFPGHVAYVWHADRHASDVVLNLNSAAFEMRCQLIWVKSNFAIGRGHYHWGHEPCWYAVRKGGSAKWCGDRTQSTTWNIAKPSKSETGHSTQKPVECMARPIRNHGEKADDVYDPFLGSGTTLIAAEQLGRKCYGMEISPQYCDVIVARWEALTGKKATLQTASE